MINKIILSVLVLFLTACTYLPEPVEEPAGVIVTENRDYIQIASLRAAAHHTGLLFYPGGLVDPHAYISLCSSFARSGEGHLVIIAKMPANLAVLNIDAAAGILEKQETTDWVIAGHSLGGAMACSLVDKDRDRFKALVLLAAYPAESVDLTDWEHPVLSVTASEDQVLDWPVYEAGKDRLPVNTFYETIAGGNHSGFGKYGHQEGDGTASISQADQEEYIVQSIQNFFIEHGLD